MRNYEKAHMRILSPISESQPVHFKVSLDVVVGVLCFSLSTRCAHQAHTNQSQLYNFDLSFSLSSLYLFLFHRSPRLSIKAFSLSLSLCIIIHCLQPTNLKTPFKERKEISHSLLQLTSAKALSFIKFPCLGLVLLLGFHYNLLKFASAYLNFTLQAPSFPENLIWVLLFVFVFVCL